MKRSAPKSCRKVLEYPLRAIAENAGVDGAVVVNRVRRMKGKNDGYDVEKDEYCDLVEAGVVDPPKWCGPPCRMPPAWPACC